MRQFVLPMEEGSESQDDPAAILDGLNESQRVAAEATEGPVMIVAGAGSGKTRTLTYRIAYLLASGKARPYQILSLTFTNKAAREMKERITALISAEKAKGLWMGTFHSIFARILRAEAEHLGYTSDFTIYDSDDSERAVKTLMPRYAVDPKEFSPRAVRNAISGAKNQFLMPAEFERTASSRLETIAATLYQPYEELLRRSNSMDFDDLLLNPLRLMEKHPEVLKKYQERWKYLMIDEYQDTNRVQYMIANKLAALHKNICVVGDDAQSIYAFRGADIRNILDFERDYPTARSVRLEQNYRSTKRILKLADSIIKNNTKQLEKTLWTDNPEGDHVMLLEASSEKDEAYKVEQIIRDYHVRYGFPHRDFAVLYRTNSQSRSIEDALRRGNIPYQVVGGVNFYQRKEIKDALAYLRLVVNNRDDESLKRVINYPVRGIGSKTLSILIDWARQNRVPLWTAVESVDLIKLSPRARTQIKGFRALIEKYTELANITPADDLARDMIRDSGILGKLREENTVESLARWENVQELINAMAEFRESAGDTGTLAIFLQEISLLTDADKRSVDGVTLMTMHASKGLEYPVVFITGLEDGLFPMSRALEDPTEMEEERRLFYVGATRAEQHLLLSHARSRFRFGTHEDTIPSRFLDEIDTSVIKTESGKEARRRSGRFKPNVSGSSRYDNVDPNYWKKETAPKRSKPASGRRVVYDEGEGGELVAGMAVEHHLFGEGKIMQVDGQGPNARITVFFSEVGNKRLVQKFAKLRRVD